MEWKKMDNVDIVSLFGLLRLVFLNEGLKEHGHTALGSLREAKIGQKTAHNTGTNSSVKDLSCLPELSTEKEILEAMEILCAFGLVWEELFVHARAVLDDFKQL